MTLLSPTGTRAQQPKSFVPKSLEESRYVFLRTDALRKPLQPPYTGPYKVVRRTRKYFVIQRQGKTTSVSVDRLKPAFLEEHLPTRPAPTVDEPPSDRTPIPRRPCHHPRM